MESIFEHKHIVFCQDHYNPLGIVRSLGEFGLSPIVIMLAIHKPYMINHSKYVRIIHLVNTIEEGYTLLVEKYGNEKYKPFIYSSSDGIESCLDLHYNELVNRFYFFNAGEQGRVSKYMLKKEIINLAAECGLPIPKTEEVAVGELPKTLKYPIFTKAVISTLYAWKGNAHICRNERELLEAYKSIRGERIILQEYIEKKNELCIDALCINKGLDLYMPIQAEYIRVAPDSYGNYIHYQRYKEGEAFFNKIAEMFKRIGYTGVFEIEFLRDKNDGLHFLEINFRNSTWSYAHTYAGVNLPIIWAMSELKGVLDISTVTYDGRSYNGIVELDDLASVTNGQISFMQWLKDVIKTDCRFYGNNKDPKPAYYAYYQKIMNFIKKKFYK